MEFKKGYLLLLLVICSHQSSYTVAEEENDFSNQEYQNLIQTDNENEFEARELYEDIEDDFPIRDLDEEQDLEDDFTAYQPEVSTENVDGQLVKRGWFKKTIRKVGRSVRRAASRVVRQGKNLWHKWRKPATGYLKIRLRKYLTAKAAAALAAKYGWTLGRKRRSTDEEKKAVVTLETDTVIIDTEAKAVVDAINRKDGKEITITDYNTGIMAVLTAEDKMCRLHEIPENEREVDLENQQDAIQAISRSGKVLDVTINDADNIDYKESTKDVKEDEVGTKIMDICKEKNYNMVWMEEKGKSNLGKRQQLTSNSNAGTDTDTDPAADEEEDGEDQGVDDVDEFLGTPEENVERRGWLSKSKGRTWSCDRACYPTSRRIGRCCRSGWGGACHKYCYTVRKCDICRRHCGFSKITVLG